MKFYITGAHGFIGTGIVRELTQQGHEAIALSRDAKTWPVFSGEYYIINLAGKNIFGRFTQQHKKEIYQSRIQTTTSLIGAIQAAATKPLAVISASAVGYYGDNGSVVIKETTQPGTDFLAKLCIDWEHLIIEGCTALGIRCATIRTSYVLGNGGMMHTLLPVFRVGLGGTLGNGSQYMPWISHKDIVNLYIYAALNAVCTGPINAVAPEYCTNKEFTHMLGSLLHRPAVLQVPAFALRTLFGEFGNSMLYSQKISPDKITQNGFVFQHQTLEACLKEII